MDFGILDSLFFHMKLRIALSRSLKNCIGIRVELYWTRRLHLVKWPFFTMLFLPIHEHERSFHLLIIFLNFVLQDFILVFHMLCECYLKVFCVSCSYCKGCFTNFFLSLYMVCIQEGYWYFFLVNFVSSGFAEKMK